MTLWQRQCPGRAEIFVVPALGDAKLRGRQTFQIEDEDDDEDENEASPATLTVS